MEPGLFELGVQDDVQQEAKEVYGPEFEAAADAAATNAKGGERSDGSEELNKEMDLHARFVWEWEKRKVKLEHEYVMAGFALSVSPDVWEHASRPGVLGPKLRTALEKVVRKLHKESNPNLEALDMSEAQIVDKFWSEFNEFRARWGVFESTER